jgi:hypothetical protein
MNGTGSFQVIRVYDPAIDFDAIPQQDWDAFISNRDVSLLGERWIEGRRPVVFHCRPLTQSERRDVRGKADADKAERAFAFAVQRVDHLPTHDGGRISWTRPSDGGKPRALADDALERFAEEDVMHVGTVIIAASFSAPDRQLFVPLRDTCRDALTAVAVAYRRRPAAQTDPSSSSDESSAPPKAP